MNRGLLKELEQAQIKPEQPQFGSGDTVRVSVRVVEGSRERIQIFEGVVIRKRNGGINQNFTVRRVTGGIGVERTFLINSPRVEAIQVVRYGKVRRAQLYYLRGRTGRAARIKERRMPTAKQLAKQAQAAALANPQAVMAGTTQPATPETSGTGE